MCAIKSRMETLKDAIYVYLYLSISLSIYLSILFSSRMVSSKLLFELLGRLTESFQTKVLCE